MSSFERYENYERDMPIARKQHSCCWCGQPILPKEMYYSYKVFDGEWDADKFHFECGDKLEERLQKGGEGELFDWRAEPRPPKP